MAGANSGVFTEGLPRWRRVEGAGIERVPQDADCPGVAWVEGAGIEDFLHLWRPIRSRSRGRCRR